MKVWTQKYLQIGLGWNISEFGRIRPIVWVFFILIFNGYAWGKGLVLPMLRRTGSNLQQECQFSGKVDNSTFVICLYELFINTQSTCAIQERDSAHFNVTDLSASACSDQFYCGRYTFLPHVCQACMGFLQTRAIDHCIQERRGRGWEEGGGRYQGEMQH